MVWIVWIVKWGYMRYFSIVSLLHTVKAVSVPPVMRNRQEKMAMGAEQCTAVEKSSNNI